MRHKGLPRSNDIRAHGPLAELADRQYGVVSIRQLRGPLGYSAKAVTRAVESGRLHRLYRGVYAVGHRHIPRQGWCLAAVLACGRAALLSHRSAGWLWGIAKGSPLPCEVTSPVSRKPRPPIVLHRARGLTADDRALVEMIPVTSLARTLLDLAATLRFDRLERTIERAEELRLLDLREIDALLARTVGHPGHGCLRRALALYREPAFTRSGLERRFLALAAEAGLPRPSTGYNEEGYELDVYWPEQRFAVELDSYRTHGSHGAFERDRLRREDLLLVGIDVTQVTDLRLAREPEQVMKRVARLRRRSGERVRREAEG